MTTFLAVVNASGAVADCLSPAGPIGADPDLFSTYRREILADYERFFTESSTYIACLDEERDRAMAELAARAADYTALFRTDPPQPPEDEEK